MWREGNPHTLLVGMQTGTATVKSIIELLQKLKMELPYNLEIPLLGIYLKKPKTLIQKNICTPIFIAALFTIAQIWKQQKWPTVDEWITNL